jgi:hypothetical protein
MVYFQSQRGLQQLMSKAFAANASRYALDFTLANAEYLNLGTLVAQTSLKKGTIAFHFSPDVMELGLTHYLFVLIGGSGASAYCAVDSITEGGELVAQITNNLNESAGFINNDSGSSFIHDIAAGSKYFFLLSWDSTHGTEDNRVRAWLGAHGGAAPTELTGVYKSDSSGFTLDAEYTFDAGVGVGGTSLAALYSDGKIGDFYYIDGQQLDYTSFVADLGAGYKPIDYAGSYGAAGFHLDFSNGSNVGADSSGNANHFTPVSTATLDSGDAVAAFF